MQIYNTIRKQKEKFTPLKQNEVGMYSCGVTVYDLCHIGHARTFIAFDVVVRYLRSKGFKVNFVRNITDIDDKIIKRANDLGISSEQLAAKNIEAMNKDFESLHLLKPTSEPKATEYMPQMIKLVETLISKGFAYVAENGDVYYEVNKKDEYGQRVAHRDIEQLQSGARVGVNDSKKNPLDFVLWKAAKENEPSWESPWGLGRPGWHLECSAMSMSLLGETFDIHCGGYDLIFPHHENECAQSEAATDKEFAKYWMHSGFLQIDKEKMSKSLNNFLTIRDILKTCHPETLRYVVTSGHYRSPLDYSEGLLDSAKSSLDRLYTSLRSVDLDENFDISQHDNNEFVKKFNNAMDDDFNTPVALSILFEISKQLNISKENNDTSKAQILAGILKYLGNILGILHYPSEEFLQSTNNYNFISKEEIENLISQREQARADKNWQKADKIRDELSSKGISIEDAATGTIWRAGK